MTCSALSRHVCQLLHCFSVLACAFSLERIIELCSAKNQNSKLSCRTVPHAEPMWAAMENNSTYAKHQTFFAVVSPVDRNLRSSHECVRAWLWLSSKQISRLGQVCSACPHSCSRIAVFVITSRFCLVMCSNTGMLAQQYNTWGYLLNAALGTLSEEKKKALNECIHAVVCVVLCFLYWNSENENTFLCCSKIPHPLLWTQGIHFHPVSSCLALCNAEREEWDHC